MCMVGGEGVAINESCHRKSPVKWERWWYSIATPTNGAIRPKSSQSACCLGRVKMHPLFPLSQLRSSLPADLQELGDRFAPVQHRNWSAQLIIMDRVSRHAKLVANRRQQGYFALGTIDHVVGNACFPAALGNLSSAAGPLRRKSHNSRPHNGFGGWREGRVDVSCDQWFKQTPVTPTGS